MIPVTIESLVMGQPPMPSFVTLRNFNAPSSPIKGTRLLPIMIGPTEAASIQLAVSGRPNQRPMTHDLFANTLSVLDARLDHVLINRVEGQTFFSVMVFRTRDGFKNVDARPSDAIAMARRLNAPIFVNDEVMELASMPESFRGGTSPEIEIEAFHSFVDGLNPEDFEG